ncbi:hypothetical protein GCM10025783_05510 [Amnibacterium soli]|uniref:SRPBCC family protein n=1 Tax=Amnibacterium soli TaxID=1282736 RepID=A0ABP8YRR4_9MICO
MFHRTFRRRWTSPASASVTWAHLADPAAVAASSSHPTVVAIEGPLQVGSVWDEYHLDDGCDFDSVRWRCTALDADRSITIEGLQSGALQRATTLLHVRDDRVEVESVLRVSPSLRAPGGLLDRALLRALLLTPFGRRMLAEAFDQSVDDDLRALTALAA